MKSRFFKSVAPATMCGAMMLGLFNVPIAAKSTTGATSSGSTSGNQTNTIHSSGACTSGSKLSGIDAQVFSRITPDHAGTIVCAKSDGFKTEVSGMNNIKNYHWTAWYKDKLNDAPDATKGTGNYHGFSADKVRDWQQYEDEIRELNGGKFPDVKEYKYPTDTKDGKLDFWGDIAGYYSVLGDPQYSSLTLKAYQQFTYRVQNVVRSSVMLQPAPPPAPPSTSTGSGNVNSGGGSQSKPSNNKGNGGGGSAQKVCPPGTITYYWKGQVRCMPKSDPNNVGGTNNSDGRGGYIENMTNPKQRNVATGVNSDSDNTLQDSQTLGAVSVSWGAPWTAYDGSVWAYKYTTYTYDETKSVLVAQATVGADAYATEIAAYGRVSLTPGSKGTLTYDVPHNKFWKVTPSYWTDGGKQTIANRSDLPYHFESEGSTSASKDGKAPNNVNLYAEISKKDKLYSFIHGYPEIEDHPGNTDETCVETDKVTCSEDETPIINIEIDIEDDEVQTQKEIDKFVHLRKDKK